DNGFVVGSLQGFTLYFESDRVDLAATSCFGPRHIYAVSYTPAKGFSAVTKVVGLNGMQAGDDDSQVSVSPDRKTIYWTGLRPMQGIYAIYAGQLNSDGSVTNAHPVVRVAFAQPL